MATIQLNVPADKFTLNNWKTITRAVFEPQQADLLLKVVSSFGVKAPGTVKAAAQLAVIRAEEKAEQQ